MQKSIATNKFAIYIHVPWCRRRCPYCDFYFVVGHPHENFVAAIKEEWTARSKSYDSGPAESLYFGGGTPSLLHEDAIKDICKFLMSAGALVKDAEITIEANPEDLLGEYANRIKESPVNRISLGVQSFNDAVLRHLGRKHTSKEAKLAIDNLKQAGFNNISIDLIVGSQYDDGSSISSDLIYVRSLNIPHISTYLLTIEEKTKFYRMIQKGQLTDVEEDHQVDVYQKVQKELTSLRYLQYDVSSFADHNFFSKHNQVYWSGGEYLGLGPGAHSMRLLPDGSVVRLHSKPSIQAWLNHPADSANFTIDELSPDQALKEALAFGLRNMITGLKPKDFAKRHHSEIPPGFYDLMKKYQDLSWLREADGAFIMTCAGALFADSMMREILSC